MKRPENYNRTIYASYVGYITQAIVNNFAPLLFLTFSREFDLTLDRIALITTVNFGVQLLVDLISARLADRIGYRVCIIAAHIFSAAGLVGLALLLDRFADPYTGILLSVVLYAVGGGLIEVLISPIVEACPTEKKEAAMSLLHSFYCWGHVGVVILSTLFFRLAGIGNWRILAVLWALVPALNSFFFAAVPLYPIVSDAEPMSIRALFREKVFWLFMIIMICAGASEQAMSQWASAFAEAGLGISKTLGDLAGPCAFAVLMGTARALYGKYGDRLPLKKAMMLSALLCIMTYLMASLSHNPVLGLAGCAVCGFSVGIFWPGTFSLAAKRLPAGGTALFAFMALAGDVGCSGGPTLVGFVASSFQGELKHGLLAAIVFPVLILLGIGRIRQERKS
ncbi:MAG: MFS transporter [Lachnospiraceae bacterium]|nr:MFS transporter [Lachnospiraceae bacterium]